MSAIPYTREEFENTSVVSLERERLLATIENGFRRLPSDGELSLWARDVLGRPVPLPLTIDTALAVVAEFDHGAEVKLMDVSQPDGETVTIMQASLRPMQSVYAPKLYCYEGAVGVESDVGVNLLRGLWLLENDPLTAKSIRRGTSYPGTVAEWWTWRPPQAN